MSEATVDAVDEQHEQPGEKPARIDPSEVVASFRGWDEIATEKYFRRSFATMGESSLALRVVEFVVLRREGMADPDAFRAAMDIGYGDLTAKYAAADDEPGDLAADPEGEPQGEA